MTKEKFEIEINTLKKFFELYCKNKHKNLRDENKQLTYKEKNFEVDLCLCEECHDAINYSFRRLNSCPHDIKPRCRNCPTPCYKKTRWNNIKKVMIYSVIKRSLSKTKDKIMSFFS